MTKREKKRCKQCKKLFDKKNIHCCSSKCYNKYRRNTPSTSEDSEQESIPQYLEWPIFGVALAVFLALYVIAIWWGKLVFLRMFEDLLGVTGVSSFVVFSAIYLFIAGMIVLIFMRELALAFFEKLRISLYAIFAFQLIVTVIFVGGPLILDNYQPDPFEFSVEPGNGVNIALNKVDHNSQLARFVADRDEIDGQVYFTYKNYSQSQIKNEFEFESWADSDYDTTNISMDFDSANDKKHSYIRALYPVEPRMHSMSLKYFFTDKNETRGDSFMITLKKSYYGISNKEYEDWAKERLSMLITLFSISIFTIPAGVYYFRRLVEDNNENRK